MAGDRETAGLLVISYSLDLGGIFPRCSFYGNSSNYTHMILHFSVYSIYLYSIHLYSIILRYKYYSKFFFSNL